MITVLTLCTAVLIVTIVMMSVLFVMVRMLRLVHEETLLHTRQIDMLSRDNFDIRSQVDASRVLLDAINASALQMVANFSNSIELMLKDNVRISNERDAFFGQLTILTDDLADALTQLAQAESPVTKPETSDSDIPLWNENLSEV